MIFITVGSQKFQFNRLLEAVDRQIEDGTINEEVFAQIGVSDYRPRHYSYKDFLDREAFAQAVSAADIIITHGGTGAIIGAVKKNKKVIAVPRLAKYGEHVDDHQLQLIEQFKELNLIYRCDDCDQIGEAVRAVRNLQFNSYESNTDRIIADIDAFISTIGR